MTDENENLLDEEVVVPVEEEAVNVPVPAPVVEPEPTPEPTLEPVVEPEPTPEPKPEPKPEAEIKVVTGKPGEKSTASYKSNNQGCEPLNKFQSITAVLLSDDGNEISRLTTYGQGNAIFKTPEPGSYALKLIEGWTDFVSVKHKNYPLTSFIVR